MRYRLASVLPPPLILYKLIHNTCTVLLYLQYIIVLPEPLFTVQYSTVYTVLYSTVLYIQYCILYYYLYNLRYCTVPGTVSQSINAGTGNTVHFFFYFVSVLRIRMSSFSYDFGDGALPGGLGMSGIGVAVPAAVSAMPRRRYRRRRRRRPRRRTRSTRRGCRRSWTSSGRSR